MSCYISTFQKPLPLRDGFLRILRRWPIMIEFDGKVFFVVGLVKNNFFYQWIQVLGSAHEAKNYSYTVVYKGQKNSSTPTLSQADQPMLSIDETANSIIENGKCLGICLKYFKKNFLDEISRFHFDVKIRNMKEEFKDENVESGVSDTDE